MPVRMVPVTDDGSAHTIPQLTVQMWRDRCEEAQLCQRKAEELASRLRERNRDYARVNYDLREKLRNRDARIQALEELLRDEREAARGRELGGETRLNDMGRL